MKRAVMLVLLLAMCGTSGLAYRNIGVSDAKQDCMHRKCCREYLLCRQGCEGRQGGAYIDCVGECDDRILLVCLQRNCGWVQVDINNFFVGDGSDTCK